LESGGIVEQETRGFDVYEDSTFRLRSKEEAKDYRFLASFLLSLSFHLK